MSVLHRHLLMPSLLRRRIDVVVLKKCPPLARAFQRAHVCAHVYAPGDIWWIGELHGRSRVPERPPVACSSISALHWHCQHHVYCAGIGALVLKMHAPARAFQWYAAYAHHMLMSHVHWDMDWLSSPWLFLGT